MRSPNWSEEVMLALDLYVNRDLAYLNRMSDSTSEIVGLSGLLNALDLHLERPKKFRSTGSIRMKLANFMALDDKYREDKSLLAVGIPQTFYLDYIPNYASKYETNTYLRLPMAVASFERR